MKSFFFILKEQVYDSGVTIFFLCFMQFWYWSGRIIISYTLLVFFFLLFMVEISVYVYIGSYNNFKPGTEYN